MCNFFLTLSNFFLTLSNFFLIVSNFLLTAIIHMIIAPAYASLCVTHHGSEWNHFSPQRYRVVSIFPRFPVYGRTFHQWTFSIRTGAEEWSPQQLRLSIAKMTRIV
jgi:hypothetical protein